MSSSVVNGPVVVGLVHGGANSEHDVSLASAESIAAALDPARFSVVPLFVDRRGRWHRGDVGGRIGVRTDGGAETATDGPATGTRLPDLDGIDVVFPALHGRFGEDGTVQALCELAGVPYVGSGVLASALAMDKARASALVERAGVDVIACHPVRSVDEALALRLDRAATWFVKPNRAGSSVGASKVAPGDSLAAAVELALAEDDTALVQPFIVGDEVDVAVLQGLDGTLRVGPPLRIRHAAAFFDYASKYDDGGASFEIPAAIAPETTARLGAATVAAFEALDCRGFARVDFFVTADGRVLFTELNSMPGMTSHSQFPQMWAQAGIPFTDLLDQMLDVAVAGDVDRDSAGGAASTVAGGGVSSDAATAAVG